MLKIFKNNNPLTLLLIPFIIAALQIVNFTGNVNMQYPKESSFVFSSLRNLFSDYSFFIFTEITTIITLSLISFLLIYIQNNLKIFKQNSHLVAFLFIFIASAIFPLYKSFSLIIGLLFFTISFSLMLNTIRKQVAIFDFFNIGFLMSVGSLFYINFVWFILFIFVGLILLRPPEWREFISSIIGFLTPYIMLFLLFFLITGNFTIIEITADSLFHYEAKEVLTNSALSFYIYIILLTVVTVFSISAYFYKLNVRIKSFLKLHVTIFIIATLLFLFSKSATNELIFLFSFSISTALAFLFNNSNRKILVEIAFDLIIILMIFANIKLSIIDLF